MRLANYRLQRFIVAHFGTVFLLAVQAAHAIETLTVIEYYNQNLDAYFITAWPTEQVLLDSTAGFQSHRHSLCCQRAADATAMQARICRLYVSGTSPFVSSHFYGVEKTDCALIQANVPAGFSFAGFYGAYVMQQRGGALTADDIRFLTFTSGYVTFNFCDQTATVGSCAVAGINDTCTATAAGKFYYSGAHMQHHAANVMGLGTLANADLASTIINGLGLSAYAADFRYTQPQLAGGIYTSANTYTAFLCTLLDRSLIAATQLNANAVFTNSQTCATAISSPFPETESPNYSIGHWVEDTLVGDGAYSSAGAFGFYPWIEPTKATYDGVLARTDLGANSGYESVPCGRKLRLARATGVVQ